MADQIEKGLKQNTYTNNNRIVSKKIFYRDPIECAPERYGLDVGSQEKIDVTGLYHGGAGSQHMSVDHLIQCLEKTYCDTIAAEFQHLRVHVACTRRSSHIIPYT